MAQSDLNAFNLPLLYACMSGRAGSSRAGPSSMPTSNARVEATCVARGGTVGDVCQLLIRMVLSTLCSLSLTLRLLCVPVCQRLLRHVSVAEATPPTPSFADTYLGKYFHIASLSTNIMQRLTGITSITDSVTHCRSMGFINWPARMIYSPGHDQLCTLRVCACVPSARRTHVAKPTHAAP